VVLGILCSNSRPGRLSDCLQTVPVVMGSQYAHSRPTPRGKSGKDCSMCDWFDEYIRKNDLPPMTRKNLTDNKLRHQVFVHGDDKGLS